MPVEQLAQRRKVQAAVRMHRRDDGDETAGEHEFWRGERNRYFTLAIREHGRPWPRRSDGADPLYHGRRRRLALLERNDGESRAERGQQLARVQQKLRPG